jgi:outer membrane beta-barrel protein
MVKRYTGGLLLAYHFSESFAAEGAFIYSPDLGNTDLKGLTHTLVTIAHEGSADVDFQQPLDKMELGATFAARWAPIYGKINIIGENVINFDFYMVAGLGMLSSQIYFAKYDDANPEQPTRLESIGRKVRVPVNLGLGTNYFLNQTIALKLDARSYLYRDLKPQYDPNTPVEEYRLYNNFVASAGISIFVPKMRPRRTDF